MRNEIAAAFAAKGVPAGAGAAGIVFLGAPAGVLITAVLGAILSFYFRKGLPDESIPRIVFGVIALAFAGAWVSVALPHVDWMGIGAMAAKVDARARAGLCALAFQSAWNLGARYLDRKAEAAV